MITEDAVDAILPTRGWLRSYVEWARNCIDTHILGHVGVALSLLSQSFPKNLVGPFGTDIKGNLFTILIGESGESRKTIAIELGRDQVLRPSQICELGETPGSREVLIDELIVQPKKLIIYPEFGSFLAASEKGYLQSLKSMYCEAFDNGPLARPTVAGKKANKTVSRVEDPRLSLLCACSEPLLERHTEMTDWCGGFLSRFLLLATVRERKFTEFMTDAPGAKALADSLAVINSAGADIDLTSGKAKNYGPCLGFSPDARTLWKAWKLQVDARIKAAPQEVRGSFSRAPIQALKIAMLLSWDYGDARKSTAPWFVTEECLAPAIGIANFHIEGVAEVASAMALSPPMRERRSILKAVRIFQGPTPGPLAKKPVPLSQIITEVQLLKRKVCEILESLEAERLVLPIDGGTSGACYIPTTPEEVEVQKTVEKEQKAAAQVSQLVIPSTATATSDPKLPAPAYVLPAPFASASSAYQNTPLSSLAQLLLDDNGNLLS